MARLVIRPSIYIGLGGTGILAISQTKKMYEEEFGVGNIPKQIAFIAIDFDKTAPKDPKLATDISTDFMQIPAGIDPRGFYEIGKEQGEYKWMFLNNTGFIAARIEDGASQVRTTGRLYTELVYSSIEARITNAFNKVQNIANQTTGGIVDVHMAMSIAGGTGAGSFMTVAHIIKEAYPTTVNLYGYGVNYGVFRAMDVTGVKTPRVVSNAYSAIMDIDYTMHATPAEPKTLTLNNQVKNIKAPFFETFYVIDNKTNQGSVVNSSVELCEVVGTSMYLSGNKLGNNIASIASNVGWQNGSYDIKNKKGWVHGLGACQIVYKGEELASVFQRKIAKVLIEKITSKGFEIDQEAINWTMREAVQIREDGDQFNQLIDSIFQSAEITRLKEPSLDINDTDARTKDNTERYLDNLGNFTNEEKIKARKENLSEQLNSEVERYLRETNGIGNVIAFLTKLKALCAQYKGEMQEEYLAIEKGITDLRTKLDAGYKEYEDKRNSFKWKFRSNDSKENILEDCITVKAHTMLKQKFEAQRRRVAESIFNDLIDEIDSLKTKAENTLTDLNNITTAYNNELERLQKNTASALQFEHDLSQTERVNMKLSEEEINNLSVATFVSTLNKPITEYGMEELSKAILAYTDTLERTKKYRETLVLDVIDRLSQEEWEDLTETITCKSSLLLDINNRGQRVNGSPANQKMVSNFMVAYYGEDNTTLTRFQKDPAFMHNVLNKHWVPMDTEIMKQRVIFYRVDGAIIPYCLNEFADHVIAKEYENVVRNKSTFNPHYDKNVYDWMLKNDFKLKPEMSNEAMFYWVCGHIFGWDDIIESERIMERNEKGEVLKQQSTELRPHRKYISCQNGSYCYWDEEAMPRPGTKKWVPLESAGTKRRDTAFNYFKTQVLPTKKEIFHDLIKSEVSSKGIAYYNGIVDNIVKAGIDDYINLLVCSNMSSITYSQKGNGGELEAIMAEFEYLSRDLKNTLSNLN